MGDTLGLWSGLTPERAGPGPSGLFRLPSESLLRASLPGEKAWLLAGTGPCLPDTSVPRPSRAWFIVLRSAQMMLWGPPKDSSRREALLSGRGGTLTGAWGENDRTS